VPLPRPRASAHEETPDFVAAVARVRRALVEGAQGTSGAPDVAAGAPAASAP
jgi:hypothetical protein